MTMLLCAHNSSYDWVKGSSTKRDVCFHCLGSLNWCLCLLCVAANSHIRRWIIWRQHAILDCQHWIIAIKNCFVFIPWAHEHHVVEQIMPCGLSSCVSHFVWFEYSSRVLNVGSVTEWRVVDVNFYEFWKRLATEQDMVDRILGWSWSGLIQEFVSAFISIVKVVVHRHFEKPFIVSLLHWRIEVLRPATCLMGLCWRSVWCHILCHEWLISGSAIVESKGKASTRRV